MSITAGNIITGVYRRLGRPAQEDMPYEDLIAITNEVYRGLLLDLKLVARNHTVTEGSWVTPSARSMATTSFTGGGDVIPVRVEWRPESADDTYRPIKAEVVAYEQINDLALKSRLASESYVAFYDGFSNILFSESATALATREYRVIYEDMAFTAATTTASTITAVPDVFISYIEDEVMMKALDAVATETPEWAEKRERLRSATTMSLFENRKRWDKWRMSLYGNKKVAKLGFRPRRSRGVVF